MNDSEIKDFAYNCLKSRKLNLNNKNIEDLDFKIKRNQILIYVEIINRKHLKTDYTYNNNHSYNLVIDNEKNVVIEPSEFEVSRNLLSELVFLDNKNILIPTISKRLYSSFEIYDNDYKHYQLDNNKVSLVSTFDNNISYSNVALENKLLFIDGKLYNFALKKLYEEKFDYIWDYNCLDSFRTLANCWRIFRSSDDIQRFVISITKKMQQEKLLAGYKEICIKRDNINYKYHTLVFIDANGNVVSDLLYVNDSLKAIDISDYNSTIETLKNELKKEIDKNVSIDCNTIITKKKKKLN